MAGVIRTRWKAFSLRVFLVAAALLIPGQAISEDGVNSCQTDAMIVLDASGSMGATDYTLKVPRIARVKQSMARVLPEVAPVRKLGLIVYGEGAYNDCTAIQLRLKPARNAAAPLLNIISSINPKGRTPLTESVRLAAETLDYTKRDAVVVLLTDGEETCGGDPCRTAALLKAASPNLTTMWSATATSKAPTSRPAAWPKKPAASISPSRPRMSWSTPCARRWAARS